VLQQVFRDDRGVFVARTDFWWPGVNLVGEFDGRGKYMRSDLATGRSPAQVVVDEKIREDALRALGHGVVRWVWEDAVSPQALRVKLTRAGLRCEK